MPVPGSAAGLTDRRSERGALDRLVEEFASLMAAAVAAATAEGQRVAATYAHWVAAILDNGLGRYPAAFVATRQARENSHLLSSMWGLPEMIEAAVRAGHAQVAAGALDELAETTQAGRTDAGLPGWPATGCPTPRSAAGCSSAPAPCSTTWARSSPSWTSPRAASSATSCRATRPPSSARLGVARAVRDPVHVNPSRGVSGPVE
jgi:hypothetical protein